MLFSLAYPDWVCHASYPECDIECPHAVHDCALMEGGRLSDQNINTTTAAVEALRIIVEAYAEAGLPTLDQLHSLTEADQHRSVMGAPGNLHVMAGQLAGEMIAHRVTRFGKLPTNYMADSTPSVTVMTDAQTHISVRAYQTNEYGRPLLVLDCIGLAEPGQPQNVRHVEVNQ